MAVSWDRLLRHLTRHGYLTGGGGGGALGPLGRLLLRNLTALWRRDAELGLNVPVVPARLPSGPLTAPSPPLADAVSELSAVSNMLGVSPPFGLCSEQAVAHQLTPPGQLTAPPADRDQLTAASADGGRLTLLVAVPAASAADWFQTLQRRRRIWWRELAEDPGNYSLAQPSTDGAEVRFDDSLVVERLQNHGLKPLAADGSGSAQNQPHLLSCEVCLQSALWAVCGDALDEGSLRLQERLAPYQRAVLVHSGHSEELRALAVHISNQLRTAGVSVFPLPVGPAGETEEVPRPADASPVDTDGAQTEEERWQEETLRRTDGAGVPLAVLLSESTLQDGVCRLRSRDTTLSHQVHVSQLTDS